MVDEKLEDKKISDQPVKENKKPALGEKVEVDLHELQIKLERIKSYVVRTDNRVKVHELSLQKLRDKRTEIESKRQGVSVTIKPKIEKSA